MDLDCPVAQRLERHAVGVSRYRGTFLGVPRPGTMGETQRVNARCAERREQVSNSLRRRPIKHFTKFVVRRITGLSLADPAHVQATALEHARPIASTEVRSVGERFDLDVYDADGVDIHDREMDHRNRVAESADCIGDLGPLRQLIIRETGDRSSPSVSAIPRTK